MKSLYELGKRKDVNSVIDIYLNSKSDMTRARALEVLGEIGGDRAIEILIKAILNEEKEELRSAAAEAIAWSDEKTLRLLVEKISGEKVKKAPWALVNRLMDILKEKDTSLRINAAIALGRLGDKRAVKPLISVLKDSSVKVRNAAVIALGMIGDSSAINPLLSRLDDESIEVRKSVLEALEDIQIGPKHAEKIKDCIHDPNPRIRELAAMILEKGGERTIDALLESLNDSVRDVRIAAIHSLLATMSKIPPSRSEEVRKTISKRLESSPDVVNVVIEAVKTSSSNSVRRNAIWLLGQLADPRGADILVKILDRGKMEEKRLAATSLARIPGVAEKLEGTFNHEDEEVRKLVCWILGEIGDENGKIMLQKALEDESEKVRRVAFQAINKIERFKK
jgi:HEAT repeat protein